MLAIWCKHLWIALVAGVVVWVYPGRKGLPENDDCLDVAIVGAGIGGTYTAWRLRNRGLKVSIFENTDRIGGRIFSLRLPTAVGVPIELGVMRYEPDQHNIIVKLVDIFGLNSTVFGPDKFAREYYFRGKRFSLDDLASEKLPFDLAPDEPRDPKELSWKILKQAFNLTQGCNISDLESTISPEGKPFYQHGLLDLVDKIWSSEGKAYLKSFRGMFSWFENNNALCGLALFRPRNLSFRPLVRTLVGGMSSLVERLTQDFLSTQQDNHLHLNHRLHSISRHNLASKSSYELSVFRTRTVGGVTEDIQKSPIYVCAKKVILACPRSAHGNIYWLPFALPDVQVALNSVTDYSAIKLFLVYPALLWDRLLIPSTTSLSDTPLRYTMEMNRFVNSTGQENVLVLAVYADGESQVDMWKQLTEFPGRISLPSVPDAYAVTTQVVEHVHHHLSVQYGLHLEDIPAPLDGAIAIWRDGDYGSAWQFFKPGYRPSEIQKTMMRPSPDDDVFIVTNSYSLSLSNWMEGCLQAADDVIKNFFPAT